MLGIPEEVDKVPLGEIEGVRGNYIGTGVEIVYMDLPDDIRCILDTVLPPSNTSAEDFRTDSTIKN